MIKLVPFIKLVFFRLTKPRMIDLLTLLFVPALKTFPVERASVPA
jgi:hypothetical protein